MSKIIASTIAGLSGAAPTFTNGVNVTGIATVTTLSATTITATNYTGIPASSDWRDASLF